MGRNRWIILVSKTPFGLVLVILRSGKQKSILGQIADSKQEQLMQFMNVCGWWAGEAEQDGKR
jgi:hypothetical protein